MGLLSRAEGNRAADNKATVTIAVNDNSQPAVKADPLDDMEKTITERIKRIPLNDEAPGTALSLLKAYSNFKTGICLSLKDEVYSSYVSLGGGIETLSIPQEKIWTESNAKQKYFQFSFDDNSNSKFWAYPLDSFGNRPWTAIMILEASNTKDSSFIPESISKILDHVSDKLCNYDDVEEILEEEVSPDELASTEALSGEQAKIRDEIAKFQEVHGQFNCVVFDGSKEDHLDFSMKVTEMINTLGTVISLSPARPLILLPTTSDCELITHRLSKSLNSRPLISFESNSANITLGRIKPLIQDGSAKEQVFTFQI